MEVVVSGFNAVGLPPPPPPLPSPMLNKSPKPVSVDKYKKFYWKMIKNPNPKLVSSFSFNNLPDNHALPSLMLTNAIEVFVSPSLKHLLQKSFLVQDTSARPSPITPFVETNIKKTTYLKQNTHGAQNLKVLEVLRKTNWKTLHYNEIVSVFLDCGKTWENEVHSFAALRVTNSMQKDINRYSIKDEFAFLEYMNLFWGYYEDKCGLTVAIQELREVAEMFRSNLNDFTHFNNVMLEEKTNMHVLMKYVVKVVSFVNVLDKEKLYCVSNLTKLKNCKKPGYYKGGKTGKDVEVNTLLDLVYLSIKDNTQICDFVDKCITFKKDILNENNSCFKKINLILNALLKVDQKELRMVESDKFQKYFDTEIVKIKRQVLPLLENYYHQMDIYNQLMYEYETVTINKEAINMINKFKMCMTHAGTIRIKDVVKFQCIDCHDDEVTLIQIMREFLHDIKKVHEMSLKEKENINSKKDIQKKEELFVEEYSYEDNIINDALVLLQKYELKRNRQRHQQLLCNPDIDISYENLQILINRTRSL